MRVAIATPFYPPEISVLATYARGIEDAFKRSGHEVCVVQLGFLTRLPSGIRHAAYAVKFLRRCITAEKVFILDTWSVGIPASWIARLLRKPYALRIGGDFLWEQYLERTGEKIRLSDFYKKLPSLSRRERVIFALIRSLVAHAQVVFFNTHFQKDIWDAPYRLRECVHVLENVYPEMRQVTPPKGRVFVAAHRKSFHKNEALLEQVFAIIKKAHPDAELDARSLPREAHLARLADSYALIIPAVSEVGSNMAIEAVSKGKPFIMSRDTGTSERLSACGLFVDTRDEKELVSAIEFILDPKEYAELVERIRTFSYIHSWDDIAGQISETFLKV